jgi:hypothetical protein
MRRKRKETRHVPPALWRVYWPLGIERLRPYDLIRGADLANNRAAVRSWLYSQDDIDRESFLLNWVEYLATRLEASEKRNPARERTGRVSDCNASIGESSNAQTK